MRSITSAMVRNPRHHHRKQVELGGVVLVVQAAAVAIQPANRTRQYVADIVGQSVYVVEPGAREAAEVEAEAALARDIGKLLEPRGDVVAHQHLVGAGDR